MAQSTFVLWSGPELPLHTDALFGHGTFWVGVSLWVISTGVIGVSFWTAWRLAPMQPAIVLARNLLMIAGAPMFVIGTVLTAFAVGVLRGHAEPNPYEVYYAIYATAAQLMSWDWAISAGYLRQLHHKDPSRLRLLLIGCSWALAIGFRILSRIFFVIMLLFILADFSWAFLAWEKNL